MRALRFQPMLWCLCPSATVIRKRKKLLGRPAGSKKETIDKYQYAKHLYDNQNTPISEACKKAGIGKTTFYRVEKELLKNH